MAIYVDAQRSRDSIRCRATMRLPALLRLLTRSSESAERQLSGGQQRRSRAFAADLVDLLDDALSAVDTWHRGGDSAVALVLSCAAALIIVSQRVSDVLVAPIRSWCWT